MPGKIMYRRHSSELPGVSGSDETRPGEDYILNASLDVVLSLCYIGILMGYGPPAWLAYGGAGAGAILFLVRGIHLVRYPGDVCKPPRWSVLSKVRLLLPYGFLFFLRDQFVWMWLTLGVMLFLVGIKRLL